jgi:hypothetical protein
LHPGSRIREIEQRLESADIRDIRKILYAGVDCGDIKPEGASKNRTYSILK